MFLITHEQIKILCLRRKRVYCSDECRFYLGITSYVRRGVPDNLLVRGEHSFGGVGIRACPLSGGFSVVSRRNADLARNNTRKVRWHINELFRCGFIVFRESRMVVTSSYLLYQSAYRPKSRVAMGIIVYMAVTGP